MLEETVTIRNKLGLHARAAAQLVQLASRFESAVELRRNNGLSANAKSIMGVMMLAAAQGTELQLLISGQDEQTAMRRISELIAGGFGEKE